MSSIHAGDGYQYEARKTPFEVVLDSQNEAFYAHWGTSWPSNLTIKPRAFRARGTKWSPDFCLDDVMTSWNDLSTIYVELKPAGWLKRAAPGYVRGLLDKMTTAWTREPEAILVIEEAGDRDGPERTYVVDSSDGGPSLTPAFWAQGQRRPMLCVPLERNWSGWKPA